MAKRKVTYMTMSAYRRFVKTYKGMKPEEKKAYDAEQRFELSLTEVRVQALAKIRDVYGPGEVGWRKCQEAGGCHWSTYRLWEDRILDVQPQARSLFKTALACGIKPNLFG